MTGYNSSFNKLPQNPCINVPLPTIQRDLPVTIGDPIVTVPNCHINKSIPPATNVSQCAFSRNLYPKAASSPSSVPSIQPPIATPPTAYASQVQYIAKNPIGHTILGQNTSRSRINVQVDTEIPMRYRDLAVKKELKRRGPGLIGELAKRLEDDDKIQDKAKSAEDYDTMSPRDIYSPRIRHCVATNATDPILKGRLKAHDRRENGIAAPGSRLSPIVLPSGPVSTLDDKGSRERPNKRPLVRTVMNTPTLVTDKAQTIGQTAKIVTPVIPKDYVGLEPIHAKLPCHNIRKACNEPRRSKVCSISLV